MMKSTTYHSLFIFFNTGVKKSAKNLIISISTWVNLQFRQNTRVNL